MTIVIVGSKCTPIRNDEKCVNYVRLVDFGLTTVTSCRCNIFLDDI